MNSVNRLMQRLHRLLTQPIGELSRVQRALRFAVDLSRHCARELKRDEAAQMAAALTYRTIFSLIPIAVMMLVVFKAFVGFDEIGAGLQGKVYSYLGLSSIALPPTVTVSEGAPTGPPAEAKLESPPEASSATDSSSVIRRYPNSDLEFPGNLDVSSPPEDTVGVSATQPPPPTTQPATNPGSNSPQQTQANQELRAGVDRIIDDLTKKAGSVNVRSIGVVGLAVLIWAALSLVITVEQTFNKVYHCSIGRHWHLRIPLYWSVITLGPFLLFISFYVAVGVVGWIEHASAFLAPVIRALSGFTALGATWLLLFLLYTLMPNTHVRARPALIGAFVAAALWEISKSGFQLYVAGAVSYSTLYGSLGLIPLFLLWLYITWLIVLFGLELTYTLQTVRGKQLEESAQDFAQQQVLNPQWLISVMVRIAQSFSLGRALDHQSLSAQLGLPIDSVQRIARELEQHGLICRTAGSENNGGGYRLARPAQAIPIRLLLDLGRSVTTCQSNDVGDGTGHPDREILYRLAQAQYQAIGDTTLAMVIGETQDQTSR